MDKTTTWIIRGAAGAFILFVLNSLINTGESTKKIINKTLILVHLDLPIQALDTAEKLHVFIGVGETILI